MAILCGSDLSAASIEALAISIALATRRGDTEVVVLHVVDPAGLENGAIDQQFAMQKAALEAIVAKQSNPGRLELRAEVRVGPPDQTLAGTAETEGCDLVVIAAASTAGGSLIQLGTTAQRVVALTTVPVILVRDPAPWLAFARGERTLRVLLGIDDSPLCELGIQWIKALRAIGSVDVVLGAIYYPDDACARYGLEFNSLLDVDPELEKLIARDLLRRFGEGGHGALVARAKRGLGRIGDHLLELARDEQVDAIIVGTTQKTGLGRLGSVSSVIVHDAPQSVICVPPGAAISATSLPTMRTALVATDLSSFANRAAPYACAVVPADGTVHVLYVASEDLEFDEADTTRQLERLVPPSTGRRVVTHIVRADDPAVAIAQTAARMAVDVICIASHGRSGITRALVGSVADKLLRATRLPVLVLRPS
ncbi:MAG: universal stress protein [Proteobacteria bacterium]|nr:universal stress protein [Pseudomonadota bacterium]